MTGIRQVLSFLGVLLATGFFYGCGVGAYYQPSGVFPSAGIYMDTTSGSLILDNGVSPTKEGKACGTGILGIIATGDTSAETAMKMGGIKKAVFVTQNIKVIVWGVYSEVCTIVRGN
jgi:hypothetical protein